MPCLGYLVAKCCHRDISQALNYKFFFKKIVLCSFGATDLGKGKNMSCAAMYN